MAQARDGYHHGDLRNALVASATRLIEQHGPTAFSLREAARDVGVSANAAYRHFDDKSSLMTAAAAEGFSRLAKRMRTAMERASMPSSRKSAPTERSVVRFKAVGRAYVEFAVDHPELFRLMFGERGVSCLETASKAQGGETPWTLLGDTLDALLADGLLPPERRQGAELKAWSVVHGFASLTIDGLVEKGEGKTRGEMLESLLDFAVLGLRGSVHGGSGPR